MQRKRVIAVSFDNVLLNQTPLHAYAAFKAYKALVEKIASATAPNSGIGDFSNAR